MNTSHAMRYFFITFMLVFFVAACAGSRHQESTGEYIDDATVTTKVKAAILQDPMLSVFQINVETFKGVVQLSGFVDSEANSQRAVQVTRSVEGVKEIRNDLVVK